jgi:cell wall-associated NlpC family hydrolase
VRLGGGGHFFLPWADRVINCRGRFPEDSADLAAKQGVVKIIRTGPLVRCGIASLVLLAILLSVLPASPASADPAAISRAKQEVAALRDQIDRLNTEVEIAVERYNQAKDDLRKVGVAIEANQKKLERTQRDLQTAQTRLHERVAQLYKGRGDSVLSAVLGARTFSDLVNRLDLLNRIGSQDGAVLTQVKSYKAAVLERKKELAAQQRRQKQLVAEMDDARTAVLGKLANRREALRGKQAEVAQLEREEAARQAQLRAEAAARRRALSNTSLRGGRLSSSWVRGDIGTGTGAAAVELAEKYLGVPYVWGGESPDGFDCSGLVSFVYSNLGVGLPRTARDQQGVGNAVSRDALRPGDLVFFGDPAHHVGIYVGGGAMINAPYTGAVVRYDPIDRGSFSGGRRVF